MISRRSSLSNSLSKKLFMKCPEIVYVVHHKSLEKRIGIRLHCNIETLLKVLLSFPAFRRRLSQSSSGMSALIRRRLKETVCKSSSYWFPST